MERDLINCVGIEAYDARIWQVEKASTAVEAA